MGTRDAFSIDSLAEKINDGISHLKELLQNDWKKTIDIPVLLIFQKGFAAKRVAGHAFSASGGTKHYTLYSTQ